MIPITKRECFRYSAYSGRVNIGSEILDQKRKVRIKVIESTFIRDNSIKLLPEWKPVSVDERENEYLEYCKLIALSQTDTSDERIKHLISLIECEEYISRISNEKLSYHSILKKMCAVDVFWGISNFVEFMDEILDLRINSPIFAIINVDKLDNAVWSGDYLIVGAGNNRFYPLATPDIIGHELSHRIIDLVGARGRGLKYSGESGAINESLADIIGSMFELYLYKKGIADEKKNEWCIGENVVKDPDFHYIRNMADPSQSFNPQPKKYLGELFGDPTSERDRGFIHTNSGVLNHGFYLLATNTSASIALNIFFKTMCKITTDCSFRDFAGTCLRYATTVGYSKQVLQMLKQINLFGILEKDVE